MKYAKLEQMARNMEPDEVAASMRSLANDNRFAAIVRVILEQKEFASDGAAALKFASSHGCLAHAAGVRYGMIELEGRIKQMCEPPMKRTPQKPPEADK